MKPTEVGQLIDESAQRDAIHVAVAPVIAAERLMPAQHVGFIAGSKDRVGKAVYPPIGIVDPFLPGWIDVGQRFWLFLYPKTITSLRHDWTHPAFEPSASEVWLRRFADDSGLSYDEMLEGADVWVSSGEYLNCGGLLEGKYVPDEFWAHYENATGRIVKEESRHNFFTCSC